MRNKSVLIPIPAYGFDPTEVAIPWKLMTDAGIQVIFTTPGGEKAAADKRMLKGNGLGLLRPLLKARKDAVRAYAEMENSALFCNPVKFEDIDEQAFDGVLLPGGHHKGIKEYLESDLLQCIVVRFFQAKKPVGAICHGVVLAARSINPMTERSVIHAYKTTALLRKQEMLAYRLTRLWLDDYYLTYPECTVEDEVKAALLSWDNFHAGPRPARRDNLKNLGRGFVMRDRNYLSARWSGDAYNFSIQYIEMINDVVGYEDMG